jgi:hypothetical protein
VLHLSLETALLFFGPAKKSDSGPLGSESAAGNGANRRTTRFFSSFAVQPLASKVKFPPDSSARKRKRLKTARLVNDDRELYAIACKRGRCAPHTTASTRMPRMTATPVLTASVFRTPSFCNTTYTAMPAMAEVA